MGDRCKDWLSSQETEGQKYSQCRGGKGLLSPITAQMPVLALIIHVKMQKSSYNNDIQKTPSHQSHAVQSTARTGGHSGRPLPCPKALTTLLLAEGVL